MTKQTNLSDEQSRSVKERFIREYFAQADEAPALADEIWHHQLRIGNAFVDFILNDPIYATLERRMRETFVDCTSKLIECSPSDIKGIMDAQVGARAATLFMSVCDEIVEEYNVAKEGIKTPIILEED